MVKKSIYILSITLNILTLSWYILYKISSPTYELGRLEKDLEIKISESESSTIKLPKGLTVRNVSQRGIGEIGQFENERFDIVITSDDFELVDYSLPKDSLHLFGNFYSAAYQKFNDINNDNSSEYIPQGKLDLEIYYSEFGGRLKNETCKAIISNNYIIVIKDQNSNNKEKEILIEGMIMKHKSGKWIIGNESSDKNIEEIGGCSGGPVPIDFNNKIIEWC